MEIVTIIVLVAGILVTLLASLVKNVGWSHKHKATVATVLSVIAGVAGAFIGVPMAELGTVASNLPQFIMSIYGTSQLMYHFILKGTSLEKSLAIVGHDIPVAPTEPVLLDDGRTLIGEAGNFSSYDAKGTQVVVSDEDIALPESPDEPSQ